jgi:hypothetical protein
MSLVEYDGTLAEEQEALANGTFKSKTEPVEIGRPAFYAPPTTVSPTFTMPAIIYVDVEGTVYSVLGNGQERRRRRTRRCS